MARRIVFPRFAQLPWGSTGVGPRANAVTALALCLAVPWPSTPGISTLRAANHLGQSAPSQPVGELTEEQRQVLREADLVFVGEVLALGPTPGRATGFGYRARQAVVYKVERFLKGRVALDEIAVHHILAGPPTHDPDTSRNQLNRLLFAKGTRLVVSATVRRPTAPEFPECPFGYVFIDDHEAAFPRPATEELVATVVSHVGMK